MADGNPDKRKKAIVLGLDGVTFDVISPLVEKGTLPGIGKIMSEGCWAALKSTIPPLTPAAWASISTGVNPGKHGLYQFTNMKKDHEVAIISSRDKQAPEIWDYLPDRKVVCTHLPFSFPLREINGIMTSGFLTPGIDSAHTLPVEVRREINARFPSYQFLINAQKYFGRSRALEAELRRITGERFSLMDFLLGKDWDLFFFVLPETDTAQHLLWGTDFIEEIHAIADRKLSELMELSESLGANLFVLSDHGFRGVNKRFYVNYFLEQAGYLKYKKGYRGLKNTVVDRAIELAKRILRMGFTEDLISRLPKGTVDRIYDYMVENILQRRILDKSGSLTGVDWDNTRACSLEDFGCIYLNSEGRFDDYTVSSGDVEALKSEISGLLTELKDPETGEELIDFVMRNEELYSGPWAGIGPDLVIWPADEYHMSALEKTDELVRPTFPPNRGEHSLKGIFMAYGPDIGNGDLGEIDICDFAPTLLHSMGAPIPGDMDGEVVRDLFTPDSEPGKTEPTFYDKATPLTLRRRIERLKSEGRL